MSRKSGKLRLGELLLQEGHLSKGTLDDALAYHRQYGVRIGEALVQLRLIDQGILFKSLSRLLRLPLLRLRDIDPKDITSEVTDFIDYETASRHRVVPVRFREVNRRRSIILATSDPDNFHFFDEIRFQTGIHIVVMLATDADIDWFISKFYGFGRNVEAFEEVFLSKGPLSVDDDDTEIQRRSNNVEFIDWVLDEPGSLEDARISLARPKQGRKPRYRKS